MSILIFVFCYLFVLKFLSDSLIDFSANLDPKYVIFDSMDSPSSYISKIFKSLISYLISLSNLIEFQRIHKDTVIFVDSTIIHLYTPLFVICSLNW